MNGPAPASMQQHERLAEVADLLAHGIQRLLGAECKAESQRGNSREELDACARVEAPCGRVQSPQSKTA